MKYDFTNYKTIPFVFECVCDATCIQFVIIRYHDGRVFDVCKNIHEASERLASFMDDEVFAEVPKDES